MMSLTFGLFTQVSGSGPLGPLVSFCNRSMHSKKDVSDFFYIHLTLSTCLHPLHTLGWFPYVIALYTFVTLFSGIN